MSLPLKEGEIEHRIIDYAYKIEYPDGRELKAALHDENEVVQKPFEGYKAGVSAKASLFRTESKLSDKWDASVATSGPSVSLNLGGSFGAKTTVAAIVEPSLVKVDGKVGPLCGTVGLNGTTGVQISEEGFKFGLMGFGVTYGVGRRYSIDTPLVSGGISPASQQVTATESSDTVETHN